MKGAERGRENQEAFPCSLGLGRTLSVDVMRQGQKNLSLSQQHVTY